MAINLQFNYGWNPRPKIHLGIAIFMCLATAITAVVFYFNASEYLETSTIIKAKVIDSKISSDGMYTPIIEYKDPKGGYSQFTSRFSSKPQEYFVGDVVEILLAAETSKPRLKNFVNIYGLASFAAFFHLFALLAASVFII
ncbi:MAG: DUF3592 domain-containing protein [Enterobacterales bacterium]|nr:DUF3592 domain-containing protein [Enterobacterales bacterium]